MPVGRWVGTYTVMNTNVDHRYVIYLQRIPDQVWSSENGVPIHNYLTQIAAQHYLPTYRKKDVFVG